MLVFSFVLWNFIRFCGGGGHAQMQTHRHELSTIIARLFDAISPLLFAQMLRYFFYLKTTHSHIQINLYQSFLMEFIYCYLFFIK